MKLLVIAAFLSTCTAVMAQKNPNDILGEWMTDDERAKIEIYKKNDEFWGKIVWLKDPNNDKGEPVTDANNPDEELRKKPIMGLNLISKFKYEKGKWVDGEIYDHDNGKTYACVIRKKGEKLEVRGYVGLTMFGRTVVWTRVSQP